MFDLDFLKIHRYLFPVRTDEATGLPVVGQGDRPQPPTLNKTNPRNGVHICRETIFTSGSLAFICYARNVLDDHQIPTAVKLCLKITAGIKKGRANYGSTSVPGETVSFECDLHDALSIWRVLRGQLPQYSRYLPLPGEVPKSFTFKFQDVASDPFYGHFEQGGTSIRVPFNEGAAMAFQAIIVAFVRIHFPHMDAVSAVTLLDDGSIHVRPPTSIPTSPDQQSDNQGHGSASTEDLSLWEEGDEEITPGLRKTVYAICLQTWPQGRKDVAQHIQRHASRRVAQRIVDAANSGDFSLLDAVMRQVDSS